MAPKNTASSSSENSLYGFNILTRYPKKNDLVQYLKDLHADLAKMEQDVTLAPRGLQVTATHLIHQKIMENADKEVRVIACCCIADILRIYAPEAPFKESDMVRVFEMLFAQIRGLETNNPSSILGTKMLYILNSMATVKSCVVPVILANHGIQGASDLVRNMFEVVLDIIVNDMPEEIYSFSAEILQACIEEFDGISEELLNVLLMHLLPSAKNDRPIAYKVVAVVLKSVQPLIQKTLVEVIHHILVGTNSKINGIISDEIIEDIYPLIYELHQIMPEVMVGIIPSLTQQLHVEESEIRQKAVRLLCALYQSEGLDYTKEFPRDFKDFIGRLNDLSATIRLEVIECCCNLMNKRSSLHYLEESIAKRLKDQDEEVRSVALSKLMEFAQENLTSLSVASVQEIVDRARDKKAEIRKASIEGLAKLYSRHLANKFLPLSSIEYEDEDSLSANISKDLVVRLKMVPSVILKSWGFPEMSSRYMVLHALQEFLLPKPSSKSLKQSSNSKSRNSSSSSDGNGMNEYTIQEISLCRATALLFLFFNIDENDKQILGSILNLKGQINHHLAQFVSIKSSNGNVRLSGVGAHNIEEYDAVMEMKQALYSISQIIPIAEKKSTFFDKLLTAKDKFIWKLIQHCVSAEDSIADAIKHREDLQRRLDSKSALGEYMGIVYDFGGHMFCDAGMIESMLEMLTENVAKASMSSIAEVVQFVAKHNAKAFASTAPFLSNWMEKVLPDSKDKAKLRQLKEDMFNFYVNTSIQVGRWIQNDHHKLTFTNRLIHHISTFDQTIVVDKLSQIISHLTMCSFDFQDDNDSAIACRDAVMKLIKQLCSKKQLSETNHRLLHNVTALYSITSIPEAVYFNPEHIKFATKNLMDALRPVKEHLWDFLQNELINSSDVSMKMKGVGIQLWCNIIGCECQFKRFDRSVATSSKRSSKGSTVSKGSEEDDRSEFEFVENLIFECLASKGATFNTFPVDIEEREDIYKSCAISGFLLMKIPLFGMTLTVERWHELGWTLLHENKSFKAELARTVFSIIQSHPVHLKFLSLPCLLANDSELNDSAQKALVGAIRRLRKTQEDIATKISLEKDDVKRATYDAVAARTMPEMILPYLLHILSYHPDFPTSVTIETEDDKRRMKSTVRCVQMLLQALQTTLRNGTSNLPFLFKQLNTINRGFVDRLDPENVGLHFVTRLAVKLLSEQVKTAENVQVYPGDIHLPRELYSKSKEGTAQMQLGKVAASYAETQVGLEVAEHTIEKAIEIAGKARSKGGLLASPSKAKVQKSPSSAERKRKERRQSNDEEIEEAMKQPKKQKVEKPKKEVPQVAPSRVLPGRSAKETIQSYTEKDEYDSDMLESDEEKPMRRKRVSAPKEVRLSTSSTKSATTAPISAPASSSKPTNDVLNISNISAVSSKSSASQGSSSKKSTPPADTWGEDEDEFDLFKSQNSAKLDNSFEKLRASGSKRKFSERSQNAENEVPTTTPGKAARQSAVFDENQSAKKATKPTEDKQSAKTKGLSARPPNRMEEDDLFKNQTSTQELEELPAATSKARKGRSAQVEEPVAPSRATRSRPIRG